MPQLKLEIRAMFPSLQNCVRLKKYLKDNKHNSLHLTLKMCSDIQCPWTLSVPRSEQFSERAVS